MTSSIFRQQAGTIKSGSPPGGLPMVASTNCYRYDIMGGVILRCSETSITRSQYSGWARRGQPTRVLRFGKWEVQYPLLSFVLLDVLFWFDGGVPPRQVGSFSYFEEIDLVVLVII